MSYTKILDLPGASYLGCTFDVSEYTEAYTKHKVIDFIELLVELGLSQVDAEYVYANEVLAELPRFITTMTEDERCKLIQLLNYASTPINTHNVKMYVRDNVRVNTLLWKSL